MEDETLRKYTIYKCDEKLNYIKIKKESSIFLIINSKTLRQLFFKKKITVIEYNNFSGGTCENFNLKGKGTREREKRKGKKKLVCRRTLFAGKFSTN